MAQRNLSTEKKIMYLEDRLVVAEEEEKGVGWTGSLGLIDADYCLQNGWAMRSSHRGSVVNESDKES